MPLKLRKTIILNLRWHRRIGLSIMAMVIFLAINGLLLNHSPGIGLSKQTLRAQWLLDWYGFQTTAFSGFKLGKQAPNKQWLSHPGGHELFLNAEPVASCQAPLLGASRLDLSKNKVPKNKVPKNKASKDQASQAQSLLLALCQDELVILTPEGELVEKLSVLNSLPENTSRLQVVGQDVLLRSNEKILSLNIDNLETQASPANVKEWSQPSPLPQELIERISQKAELPGISMETLILDLHSGRFFGNVGVLFVDLIGLLVCVLALTGLWAWYSHHRLKKLGD